MASLPGANSSRDRLAAGDPQRAVDGLLRCGWNYRGDWLRAAGDPDWGIRRTRLANRGAKTICCSQALDVAMFSVALLGRRTQDYWRAGDGQRSPGGMV